jgi:hypothetical protein
MAVAEQELAFLDKAFDAAEEPTSGNVPDGKYRWRVESVEVARSKKGHLGLSQELVVLEGEYQERHTFRWNGIPEQNGPDGETEQERKERIEKSMQQLAFLKKDLKAYGINTEAPGFSLSRFLANELSTLLDRIVEGEIRTTKGKDRPNVYINKLVGGPGAEAATSTGASPASAGSAKPGPGQPGYDPFGDQ